MWPNDVLLAFCSHTIFSISSINSNTFWNHLLCSYTVLRTTHFTFATWIVIQSEVASFKIHPKSIPLVSVYRSLLSLISFRWLIIRALPYSVYHKLTASTIHWPSHKLQERSESYNIANTQQSRNSSHPILSEMPRLKTKIRLKVNL